MNRNKMLSFRVNEKEYQKILKKSYGHYCELSEYLRSCALEKDITVIEGLPEFTIQLRRIGTNLNQLTRLANEGQIRCLELTEVRSEVEKLWQSLNSQIAKAAR